MGKKNDRRTMLSRIITFWALVTSLPFISAIIQFIYPPARRFVGSQVIGAVDDLAPNTGRVVQLGERPVLFITTDTGEHLAYGANCTHLGCVVQFREDQGDIFCACHGSVFTLDGAPVSGPANRPLEQIPITIENNQVTITTPEGPNAA
jgi:cytochrome b6-f complex iron-sulfur subunit